MPSFYVNFGLYTNETIIEDEEFHHIVNVFRHKIGDNFNIINGKGLSAEGTIAKINKKSLVLKISNVIQHTKNKYKIACAFALLKNKNDLFIIEKLTELGVDEIFPITTINSVKSPTDKSNEKYLKTSIAAIKQCDNPFLPKINSIMSLENLLSEDHFYGYQVVICSERKPELKISNVIDKINNYCLIIGPEGGFTNNEFDFFNNYNLPQVALVKNTLRAETATIFAISVLINEMEKLIQVN
jgi:16S rRNA (uracil1498-N3)-methyltransferase